MKRLIIKTGFIALTLVVFILHVQAALASTDNNVISTWVKTYGGNSYDDASIIRQTSDGGYIVAGWTYSANGASAWVFKLNPLGNIEWQKTYGSNQYNYAQSIQQTADGGYILTGYINGGAAVIKLSSNGDIQWKQIFKYGQLRSIQQTIDEGYIIAWYSFVMKLDSYGNIQWQKAYSIYIDGNSIQQTTDSGYILISAYQIIKLDADGNIQWQRSIINNGLIMTSQQTSKGEYVLAGFDGNKGALVIKLDRYGNALWQKRYLGITTAISIQEDTDGGYIVAAGYDKILLKLDSDGNIQWQKKYTFGLGGAIRSMQKTVDRGYVLTGYTSGNSSSYLYEDVFVLKVDTNGNISGCASKIVEDAKVVATSTDDHLTDFNGTVRDINIPLISGGVAINNTNVIPKSLCNEELPIITYYPSSLEFGSVELSSYLSQLATLSNTGNSDLLVNSIAVYGENASSFTQTNNCSVVAPNTSCGVSVTFTPISLGTKSAILTISSNDSNTPTVEIPLVGTGVDSIPPSVAISASSTMLWPPNHKMLEILISGSTWDTGSGIASVEITVMDEYGAFNMTVPGFGSTIQLEAWREGTDMDGRHYTITAVVTDKAGNQSTATTEVVVPHDMR